MTANKRRSLPGIISTVLLLACITLPAAAEAKPKTLVDGTLTICLYPDFQPFIGKKDGVWSGWEYDYLQAFANEQGLKLAVRESDFNGIWTLPGLK
jgi:hypothetical protein